MSGKAKMVCQSPRAAQSQDAIAKGEREWAEAQSVVRRVGTKSELQSFREWARKLSAEELRVELSRQLEMTADSLVRLAVIVHELESRGDDLSEMKNGMIPLLRQIAAGELLPELVVMLSGKPDSLKQATKLSVDEQRQIVKGEKPAPTPRKVCRQREQREPVQRPNITMIAEQSSPRDIADMAADLVLSSSQQQLAVQHLCNRLKMAGYNVI